MTTNVERVACSHAPQTLPATRQARLRRLSSGFLACAALTACGGGGGGGAPAPAPAPGAGGANVSSRCASYDNLLGHTVVMTDGTGVTTWSAATGVMFEGHSAVEITQQTVLTAGGMSTIKAYGNYDAASDLLTGYGNISSSGATYSGTTVRQEARVVVSPPVVSSQFALAAGQSVTETWNESMSITVVTNGVAGTPVVSNAARTFTITFDGIQPLTTPAGTYNVCRFVSTLAGQTSNQVDYVLADSGIGITPTTTSIVVDGQPLSGL